MSPSRLWTGLTRNRARTHPQHPDPRLQGRIYAIPYAKVWRAMVEMASGGLRGWSLIHADEDLGVLEAESRTLLFRFVDDIKIRISLDENAQTRVDMESESRKGKGDFGKNARRIRKFFRVLDRKIGAGPETILTYRPPVSKSIVLLLVLLSACSPREDAPPAEAGQEQEDPASARNFQGRGYERHIVFLTAEGDSTLLVPWSFTTRTRPGGVDRDVRGWLSRSNSWEPFANERWEGPPSRVPWRILPWGPVRIVVGLGDALERIIFQEGGRSLEVGLGDLLVEWSGSRAQVFRVHQGTTLLSDTRVAGFVLDMTRAWASEDPPPGDWAFLIAGDSLQIVLENTESESGADGGSYSGWARMYFTDRQWQGVRFVWSETRAFEPARRDVPMSWEIQSRSGAVTGTLTSVAPYLEAGEGEDPMLPVKALFLVEGTLVLDGQEFPVRGLIHHHQG